MIQNLFSTLFQVIVPLSLPVLAGALLSRFKQLEIKPLLTLVLYYLTPVLIFQYINEGGSFTSGYLFNSSLFSY